MSVPNYTRKAITKYQEKFDRLSIAMPLGTKERIKKVTDKSCNAFIVDALLKELDRIESENK